ncbi:MAG: hypothetical protein IPK50_08395 [Fibrobacterota bacterium]|nr:hypothetical protein [Fibrobacterota bacterium]QQS06903.1 MAG: hypothetical protein IPK50_08395 [Fibrobacterota bacterium]
MMPEPILLDPSFDGHPERPFASLSFEEKLDELWLRACAVRRLRELAGEPVNPPE